MITIDLSPRGDRIFLVSPRPTPGLAGVVPGASFSKVNGAHWSLPLNMAACRALRKKFGSQLRVGSALSEWARVAIETERRMHELGNAHDAELRRIPQVSPVLAAAMATRTYQRSGARFVAEGLLGENRSALVADQPGIGKTLEAIGGIIESGLPGPYLVVCPKTAVESVWAREIPRWWPGSSVVTVPDGRARRDEILDAMVNLHGRSMESREPAVRHALAQTWLVVHPEAVRTQSWWECEYVHRPLAPACGVRTRYKAGPKELDCGHDASTAQLVNEHTFPQLFEIPWSVVIVDESDRALLRPTGTPNQTRRGMEMLPTLNGRIAMSGTPFRSRPKLLWGTLNWLMPKRYTGFWRWAETYYDVDNAGWGGSKVIGGLREDRIADLDFELRGAMIRRTKAEVAPDLPAKTYGGTPLVAGDETSPVGVWLTLPPTQRKLYDAMAAASSAVLEGGELNAIGILAEMTRLKQFATASGRMEGTEFRPALPSGKFDWLLQHLIELGYPEAPQDKVIVVSQWTQVLKLFRDEIRKQMDKDWQCGSDMTSMLTGEITGPNRVTAIDRFNMPVGSDSPHVLFMQIKTGGVAITIDSADQMVFLDETWIPDDHEQAEDRIHRVSKPRPVTYWYLRTLDTVEEGIAMVGMERRQASHLVLDGRRGIPFNALRSVLDDAGGGKD